MTSDHAVERTDRILVHWARASLAKLAERVLRGRSRAPPRTVAVVRTDYSRIRPPLPEGPGGGRHIPDCLRSSRGTPARTRRAAGSARASRSLLPPPPPRSTPPTPSSPPP